MKKASKTILMLTVLILGFSIFVACKNDPEVKYFTVSFYTEEGFPTVQPITGIKEGERISQPTIEDKQGYYFNGWYTSAEYFTKFDFDTPITANLTLYGQWISKDISQSIAEIDFNKLVFGKAYTFGIENLPQEIQSDYIVEITDGGDDYLEWSDNSLCVLGIGFGKIKIFNNVEKTVYFDDWFQIDNSMLVLEIREQLIRDGVLASGTNEITKEDVLEIQTLNLLKMMNDDPDQAEGIALLKNLRRLSLKRNGLTNINFARNLTELRYLDASDNKISDISALAELSLNVLILDNNNIDDISALNTVPMRKALTKLSFANNNVTNIDALSNLLNLEDLAIGNNKIAKSSPIANLTKITRLDISNTGIIISDVRTFTYFSNLVMLDIGGMVLNGGLTDLGTNMLSLEELYISGITGAGGSFNSAHLESFPSLHTLDISNNNITPIDFDSIGNLSNAGNYKKLKIGGNKFTDLPDMSSFTALEIFDISDSRNLMTIENFSTLQNKSIIKELYINNCASLESSSILDFMESFDEFTSLEKFSLVDGLHYINESVLEALIENVNTNDDFQISIFEDEWVSKVNSASFKSSFYFDLTPLRNLVNGIRATIPFNGQRTVVINFINDMPQVQNNINLTIIIPKEIWEVRFVGMSQRYANNFSIEIANRKEIDCNISLHNFNMVAPVDKIAIDSPFENAVIIGVLGIGNSIKGGDGDVASNGSPGNSGKPAINANSIEINAKGNASDNPLMPDLLIRGGAGSKGGTNYGNSDGQNGGAGANGLHSKTNVTVYGMRKVEIYGGKGGNASEYSGANERDGGNGGNGGYGIYCEGSVFLAGGNTIVYGGAGGDGTNGNDRKAILTNGGNGGDAGNGGHALVANDGIVSSGTTFVGGAKGQKGIGGAGHSGGKRGSDGNEGLDGQQKLGDFDAME